MQARSPLEMPFRIHTGEADAENSVFFAYCYICQRVTSEPLVSNPTDHRKILGFISERAAFGDPVYCKINKKLHYLTVETLTFSKASFHGSCYRKTVHAGNYKKIRDHFYTLYPRKRPTSKKLNISQRKSLDSRCLLCNGHYSNNKSSVVVGNVLPEHLSKLQDLTKTKETFNEVHKLFLVCLSSNKPLQVASHESCWKKHIGKILPSVTLKPMLPGDVVLQELVHYINEKFTLCDSIDLSLLMRTYQAIRSKYKLTSSFISLKSFKHFIKSKLGDDIIIRTIDDKFIVECSPSSSYHESSFGDKSAEECLLLLCGHLKNIKPHYDLRSRKSVGSDSLAPLACTKSVASLLPDEILLKIFSHLTTEELGKSVIPVCNRWRDVGYDPVLWQHVVLHRDELDRRESVLTLLRRCPSLQSLTIEKSASASPPDVSDIISVVSQICPQLSKLRASHRPTLSTSLLTQLVDNCPDLRIVDLSHFIDPNISINPLFLSPLTFLKKLEYLDIGHTRFISGSLLVHQIAQNCKSLEKLNIAGYLMEDSTYRILTMKIAARIKSLAISPSINTKTFSFITHCVALEDLFLKVGYHATTCEQQLSSLRSLRNLRVLRLQFVDHKHDREISQLFREPSFASLETIELSGYHDDISDHLLNLISSTMPNLKNLTLNSLIRVTDIGLSRVLQQCRKLERLVLIDMDSIAGICVEKQTRFLSSLKYLQITCCPRFTSLFANQLRMKKALKNLSITWESC